MGTSFPSLDTFLQKTQFLGSVAQSHSNNLYGINQTKIKPSISPPQHLSGYVFFTRPQLNLMEDNIVTKREYMDYLTKKETSIKRYVRNMLDPRLHYQNVRCPLVDPLNVFIPILTNQVETVSGWPDIVLPTHTSPEGLKKNQYSRPDGITKVYNGFDLNVTFRNTGDEAIMNLIHLWIMYMGDIFRGHLSPYTDFLIENERDFDTRIYRLIMSKDNQRVVNIAATGVSFPINIPISKRFDLTGGLPYGEQTKDTDIRFKCMGAEYMDPITVYEFNMAVSIFNPLMRQINKGESQTVLGKIPLDQHNRLRNHGYPRINPATSELEWWCEKLLID